MATVYDEIRAERERAHTKHGPTSMENSPVDALYRAAVLGEEIGEAQEATMLAVMGLLLGSLSLRVQRTMIDGHHEGDGPDLSALRTELIQVAAMAAAWADRIGTAAPTVSDEAVTAAGDAMLVESERFFGLPSSRRRATTVYRNEIVRAGLLAALPHLAR